MKIEESVANFKSTEMRFLDSIFDMGGGYVLDFSNRTMDEFFMEELEIDISHEMFSKDGTSKARRVRYLLQNADHPTVARVLEALWKYRQSMQEETKAKETVVNAEGRFLSLLESVRSPGQPAEVVVNPFAAAAIVDQEQICDAMKQRLKALRSLPPHKRGYEFEVFLKDLFDSSKLQGRPFDWSANKSMVASNSETKPIWSRQNGSEIQSAQLSYIRSTASWIKRPPGRVGSSSVMEVSHRRAFMRLAGAEK